MVKNQLDSGIEWTKNELAKVTMQYEKIEKNNENQRRDLELFNTMHFRKGWWEGGCIINLKASMLIPKNVEDQLNFVCVFQISPTIFLGAKCPIYYRQNSE